MESSDNKTREDKARRELERYQLISDYFKASPERLSEKNRKYRQTVEDRVIEIAMENCRLDSLVDFCYNLIDELSTDYNTVGLRHCKI